ncbi:ABC transporter substrate-binding protein [Paenisporosarcina sp. TG20]|uniref:ABC transporter substrate-binding protein n=1 Tax=Paenisporosarcina sp. TG20 TaxID=1211706 RepID=UPI0002DDCC4E|nr:ABC transporter substrate-binding protein [Paenisporosarcina sp. TG20]
MKKWLGMLLVLVLMVGACSKEEMVKVNDDVSKDNPSGDLAPLNEKTKVVIAEDGSASGAGFYIANEKGYFDDYNIEVEFATFANSDDMLPALASGEVDIAGGISSAAFFNAIAQGIDVKIIADKGHNAEGRSYFTFVIGADKQDEIKEYSDLKGKRIAVSGQHGVDDYIYHLMLEHAGLTKDDVEFVLMPDFGTMLAAIENGSIDAALNIEPLITQGVSQGMHVRFGDATDFAPEAQIAMVLGSPQFMNDEQEVSLRFMAAYLKGVRDYNDAFKKDIEKDEIIEIMAKYTALKDVTVWEDVFVTGLDPNGKMFIGDIRDQYELYKKNGAIRGEFKFDEAIDTAITEKAVEIIGIYE